MNLAKAFGIAVRFVRESEKLTQDELAGRIGVHFTAIGRIERGETQCRIDTMDAIAGGFDMPLSDLIRQAEELGRLRIGKLRSSN